MRLDKDELRTLEEAYLKASGWNPTERNGHRRWYLNPTTLIGTKFDEALELQLLEDRLDPGNARAPKEFATLEEAYKETT